jgi:hypothetical protein
MVFRARQTGKSTLLHHLYPLILPERPLPESGSLNYEVESPLPLPSASSAARQNPGIVVVLPMSPSRVNAKGCELHAHDDSGVGERSHQRHENPS